MSGEGATGPAFDALGNALRINPARGGMALYDPARISIPEAPVMQKEGDIVLYKKWLRHLSLLLASAGQAVALYAGVYDPTSIAHKEALSFIDPNNRRAYYAALHMQSELKFTMHCFKQIMFC